MNGNGNSTPGSASVWTIQVVVDSDDGLIAEVQSGNVQVAVFTLDPFPDDEEEPMVVLVDPDVPRYNAFWKRSSVPMGVDFDSGAGIARVMAFTIMKVQALYGVG